MARITVEDCLEKVSNRFTLILVAAERSKQLLSGTAPLIENGQGNKEVVTSLREVAAGMVGGFGGVLTVLADIQAKYINTPKDGPFKPETYKY